MIDLMRVSFSAAIITSNVDGAALVASQDTLVISRL